MSTQRNRNRCAGGDAQALQAELSLVLAEVLQVGQVPADRHFFEELGADSMLMARFCARLRKRADLPSVSMREIYANPTVRSLVASLDGPDETPPPSQSTTSHLSTTPASRRQYVVCGALQALFVLAYFLVVGYGAVLGYEFISAGSDLVDTYLRTVAYGGAAFATACVVPILARWVLVGRWKREQIPAWSLAYLRFWVVKTLVRTSPLALFTGSPLYVLYLRALGARIGRRVVILSKHLPVCTDLLEIGDDTVIRKDAFVTCYRAHAGAIQTGGVRLGRGVVIGQGSVVDVDTSMGDGAQLGHASSLQQGQTIPPGEHRHGYAAAAHTKVDYRTAGPRQCGTLRRTVYGGLQLLSTVLLRIPLTVGGIVLLVGALPGLDAVLRPEAFGTWTFHRDAAIASVVVCFGSLLAGLILVLTVPRVLNFFVTPDTDYRLYGFHYWAHSVIARLTNLPVFAHLLGDSSYIVGYLRALGYHLSPVVHTGSNFGLEVAQDNPFLCSIGSGTMVADGLSIINADYSSTSFRLSWATIGAGSYFGNYVIYPPQGRTGNDVLIGTKAMVPLDGPVREHAGLLGSPSFDIPRAVLRDSRYDGLGQDEELRRRLAAKNRHNAVTIALYLLAWCVFAFELTLVSGVAAYLYGSMGASVVGLSIVAAMVLYVVHFVLVERLAGGFRALEPRFCSIYQPYFWWHERYWKLSFQPLLLEGTPFKSLTWRLQGVRIGRRVLDDGCLIMEKTLVTIGDDCTLNAGSIIQPHSQESGTFKSDHIRIGAGCTLGIGSLVHYGVTIGDHVVLGPDSFLMKGEDVPSHAQWGGNPAADQIQVRERSLDERRASLDG